jgi:hypothetical protein
MKKSIVLMIALALSINKMLVAQESESRLSFGFDYGNFFEKRTNSGTNFETYMGSPGLDLNFFHLWNNFGFYHTHQFLFPSHIQSNIDGYDYFFQYNFIIGPAFKIPFATMDMTLGAGFSMGLTTGEPTSLFSMGIGGDIGFSWHLNDLVYINLGSAFSYHFANQTSTGTGEYEIEDDGDREEIEYHEWSRNYRRFGIVPYIKIGFSIR